MGSWIPCQNLSLGWPQFFITLFAAPEVNAITLNTTTFFAKCSSNLSPWLTTHIRPHTFGRTQLWSPLTVTSKLVVTFASIKQRLVLGLNIFILFPLKSIVNKIIVEATPWISKPWKVMPTFLLRKISTLLRSWISQIRLYNEKLLCPSLYKNTEYRSVPACSLNPILVTLYLYSTQNIHRAYFLSLKFFLDWIQVPLVPDSTQFYSIQ